MTVVVVTAMVTVVIVTVVVITVVVITVVVALVVATVAVPTSVVLTVMAVAVVVTVVAVVVVGANGRRLHLWRDHQGEGLDRVRCDTVRRRDRDLEGTRRRRRTGEHTSGLIVIPPATGLGLNANVGAGEPETPVNAKLYGDPTVPAVGVPVKSGATSVFAGLITSVNVFTASGTTPFDAVTVIGNEPAVVGVPERTPAAEIVIPPATGVGLNANVGAGEPEIPVNAKLYGVPTVPAVGVPVKSGATSVFAGRSPA